MNAIVTFPRETDELWPFTVLVDEQATTTGVETCITEYGGRPSSWTPAVVRDGKTCVRIAALGRGDYQLWVRGQRGDEDAVLDLGPFRVS